MTAFTNKFNVCQLILNILKRERNRITNMKNLLHVIMEHESKMYHRYKQIPIVLMVRTNCRVFHGM